MSAQLRQFALVFVITALLTVPAFASLQDIHTDQLPHDESIQVAYAEAASVEQYASAWSATWTFETPKERVASTLKDSLAKLQKAAEAAPNNNLELLLLTGLVAHYAYNVDVEASYDVAVKSLQSSQNLAPGDFRPPWFLGNHLCQAGSAKTGMEHFLAVENRWAWNQLSAGFWDDYIYCASLSNMPAHALRAGDHLRNLSAPASQTRDFLLETARKRFKPADLEAEYSAKEVWDANEENSRPVFKSTMCGFSFSPLGDWKLRRLGVQKGLCIAQMGTGPHKGKAGEVTPSVTVIAMRANPGESLADFLARFMKYPSPQPLQIAHCPSAACIAYEADAPGVYGVEGNGHPITAAFKRDAPEFPGLIFERPDEPHPEKGKGPQAFHPRKYLRRMDGTLYYLVMLDTADSVLEDAKKDYDIFLRSLQVE